MLEVLKVYLSEGGPWSDGLKPKSHVLNLLWRYSGFHAPDLGLHRFEDVLHLRQLPEEVLVLLYFPAQAARDLGNIVY